jgi:hypothetical protein
VQNNEMSTPIDLCAGFTNFGKKPGMEKIGIKITSTSIWFDPNDRVLAQATALAIVKQIKENLQKGQSPTGEYLPALKTETLKRREYEAAQGARGGEISPHFKDPTIRQQGLNNYNRDYTAARGGSFTPKAGGPRGILSGALAASFASRPGKDGKSMFIFVSAKRGRPRPARTSRKAELKSALESVFGSIPLWNEQAARTPEMQAAMAKAVNNLLGKNAQELQSAAFELIKEAIEAGKALAELGEAFE